MGRERFWSRCEMWQGSCRRVIPCPRDDLKPSVIPSADLTSVSVFRGQRWVHFSQGFESGCLPEKLQRSV